MKIKKIFSCIGTRADIIKMSPILQELSSIKNIISYVCISGQHKELAYNAVNELKVNYNRLFNIMKKDQTLDYVLSVLIQKFSIEMKRENPNLVLIHGDTTTALAGALSAYYLSIPIFHIEAGLRTYSSTPFPEELHRMLITRCATFFACPDSSSKQNLLSERVQPKNIFVTGNSIIDVLYNSISNDYLFENITLRKNNFETSNEIVVTMHRRELSNENLKNICNIMKSFASERIKIFWPVHPNPRISDIVYKYLDCTENVFLLPPIGVKDMHNLLYRATLILSDSAGIQEEAFFLEKPIFILRDKTERIGFLDITRSKLINPNDRFLYDEIERSLQKKSITTNFSIKQKLFAQTGVSRKISSAIIRSLKVGSNE